MVLGFAGGLGLATHEVSQEERSFLVLRREGTGQAQKGVMEGYVKSSLAEEAVAEG